MIAEEEEEVDKNTPDVLMKKKHEGKQKTILTLNSTTPLVERKLRVYTSCGTKTKRRNKENRTEQESPNPVFHTLHRRLAAGRSIAMAGKWRGMGRLSSADKDWGQFKTQTLPANNKLEAAGWRSHGGGGEEGGGGE